MAPQHCRCREGTLSRAFSAEGFSLYERLDLEKDNCTQKDIVEQYQRLTDENHPDKHPDDEERKVKFFQVSEAYAVLSDPEKKKVYDNFGSLGLHVGRQVGYNKVERWGGYNFMAVIIIILSGCCFCCCCYFCYCFCCGLCLPETDTKTARGTKEGRVESQNPYDKHMHARRKPLNDRVITHQPPSDNNRHKEEKNPTSTTFQKESEDLDSSNDQTI
ncbi:dnaJ homolog subfamily C member 5-like [Symsagittifera roscoffensis]|uniref:dnaJ homolog subfamily C member 5-like n=1 Tax=Symsagittifera roscoffensis TaxID=84072 RepID=UPI00307C1DC8